MNCRLRKALFGPRLGAPWTGKALAGKQSAETVSATLSRADQLASHADEAFALPCRQRRHDNRLQSADRRASFGASSPSVLRCTRFHIHAGPWVAATNTSIAGAAGKAQALWRTIRAVQGRGARLASRLGRAARLLPF